MAFVRALRHARDPIRSLMEGGGHHPSALRNRPHILAALQELLPSFNATEGTALEIASGSGAHVEVFADAFPKLRWQPTELDDGACARITTCLEGRPTVNAAVQVDCSAPFGEWGVPSGNALCYNSNMFHISPWETAGKGLLAGAGAALRPGGVLVTYGPYKIDGEFTTESNRAFDESLRARDPRWGYRDVADVAAEAARHGLVLKHRRDMPANNFLLAFVKAADDDGAAAPEAAAAAEH